MKFLLVICVILTMDRIRSLENGLARKPPMGWLSWVAFWCEVDCKNHPLKCVSQKQLMDMADRMVEDGYRDVGYEFVIVDDCWLAKQRDPQGRLQPDPQRFSKGMKWMADYMHTRKLKFGIYEDYGTKTCGGYPGSMGYAEIDAQTFASWEVDYVKLDGCNANISQINEGYPLFGRALNATGRPIVYSCEWPLYAKLAHEKPNYTAIRQTCNVWRNTDDIYFSWASLIKTIDFFNKNQDDLIEAAGPGGWNDPDMLVIGNPGITVDQAKVQMALWSIWSAPLLMSVDLRFMAAEFKAVLQNKQVIAINQDPLGLMGRLVSHTPNVNVYVKRVTPVLNETDYSYAMAFLNRDTCKQANVTIQKLESLGLRHEKGYLIENLFENAVYMLGPKDSFQTIVNPTGITMFKATVIA